MFKKIKKENFKNKVKKIKDKEFFNKTVLFLKTTKGKITLLAIAIGTVAFCVGYYLHYEKTKPIGTKEEIVISAPEAKRGKDFRAKDVLAKSANGEKVGDRGYKYLFELPIQVANSSFGDKADKKEEFNGAEAFIKNEVTLLSTKDANDASAAAAAYSRNGRYYKFTTDENLIASGIGRDAMNYFDYISLLDGVSQSGKAELESDFGRTFKSRIGTPFSSATIATALGISGLSELVDDDNSTVIKEPVVYQKATQFKDFEDIVQKAQRINIESTDTNKAWEAWNKYKNLNSIYQIEFKEIDSGRDVTVFVLEDQSGRLTIYGVYYNKIYKEDQWVRTYLANPITPKANLDDLNWNTFKKFSK